MTRSRTIARLVGLSIVLLGVLAWWWQSDGALTPPLAKAPPGKAAERRAARLAARNAAEDAGSTVTGTAVPTPQTAAPADSARPSGTAPPAAAATAASAVTAAEAVASTTTPAQVPVTPTLPAEPLVTATVEPETVVPVESPPSAPAGDPTDQSPLQVLRDETIATDVAEGELPIPPKIARYAAQLLAKYDLNSDGILSEPEWSRMRGNPRLIDLNFDGLITRDELAGRVASYGLRRSLRLMPVPAPAEATTDSLAGAAPPAATAPANSAAASALMAALTGASEAARAAAQRQPPRYYVPMERLPKGLADWFVDNDADGDGQVTMSEFSASLSEADVLRFREYDLNGDGVITPQEFVGAEMTRRAAEEAQAAATEAAAAATQSETAPPETTARP